MFISDQRSLASIVIACGIISVTFLPFSGTAPEIEAMIPVDATSYTREHFHFRNARALPSVRYKELSLWD